MDFFLEPFWYNEYHHIHFQYYTKLDSFKKKANNEYTEEEIKIESYELNTLHKILNSIRNQYESYFCSEYKDFEKLFDISNKHKSHEFSSVTIYDGEYEDEYEMESNLIIL